MTDLTPIRNIHEAMFIIKKNAKADDENGELLWESFSEALEHEIFSMSISFLTAQGVDLNLLEMTFNNYRA